MSEHMYTHMSHMHTHMRTHMSLERDKSNYNKGWLGTGLGGNLLFIIYTFK